MATETAEMSAELVSGKIRAAFPGCTVQIEDISDSCGYKYSVVVVADEFEGQSLIQRHRAVNTAVAEEMKIIHALAIKAFTQQQWQQQQSSSS